VIGLIWKKAGEVFLTEHTITAKLFLTQVTTISDDQPKLMHEWYELVHKKIVVSDKAHPLQSNNGIIPTAANDPKILISN